MKIDVSNRFVPALPGKGISGRLSTRLCAALAVVVLLTGRLAAVPAAPLTLEWDPSPDPTVIGYRLYWGVGDTPDFQMIDVGHTNVAILPPLEQGQTYSFYVTAYDVFGAESEPSDMLVFTAPLWPVKTRLVIDTQGNRKINFSVPAVPGKHVGMETSTNLVDWSPLRLSSTNGGSINITLPIATNPPMRYYRSVLLD